MQVRGKVHRDHLIVDAVDLHHRPHGCHIHTNPFCPTWPIGVQQGQTLGRAKVTGDFGQLENQLRMNKALNPLGYVMRHKQAQTFPDGFG